MESESDELLITLLSLGAVIIAILVLVLIWYFCRRKRESELQYLHRNSLQSPSRSENTSPGPYIVPTASDIFYENELRTPAHGSFYADNTNYGRAQLYSGINRSSTRSSATSIGRNSTADVSRTRIAQAHRLRLLQDQTYLDYTRYDPPERNRISRQDTTASNRNVRADVSRPRILPTKPLQEVQPTPNIKVEPSRTTFANASKLPQVNYNAVPFDYGTINQDNSISEQILDLQVSLRSQKESPGLLDESVRKVQQLLLNSKRNSLKSDGLIIGVDATPATLAGYLVNLKSKQLHYYVIKRQDFPWKLHDLTDCAEFEMKNLNFALVLWRNIILKNKILEIYTDNFAVDKYHRFKNKYGNRSYQLIQHYLVCEKCVNLTNKEGMHVNKFKNLENFAKFIQPADDLSRWKIKEGISFLKKFYGINKENVFGTHSTAQQQSNPRGGRGKRKTLPGNGPRKRVWYNATPKYLEVIKTVNSRIESEFCCHSVCNELLRSSLKESGAAKLKRKAVVFEEDEDWMDVVPESLA